MTTLLIIVHVLVSLFLIVIVLLQHGKGADIGATFGGSGQSVFGTEGPVPLLNKITTFSAIVFMGTSISLAYISANKGTGSIMEDLPVQEAVAPVQKEAPVTIPMPEADIQPVDQVDASVQEVAPEEEAASPVAQESETVEAEATAPTTVEEEPVSAAQETEVALPAEESAEQAAPVEQAVEPETAPEKAE